MSGVRFAVDEVLKANVLIYGLENIME